MNDNEYDILDELYFVTPFAILKKETGLEAEDLRLNLINLIDKGFVKVFVSMDEEVESTALDMEMSFNQYYYLATKKGLFEHNSL